MIGIGCGVLPTILGGISADRAECLVSDELVRRESWKTSWRGDESARLGTNSCSDFVSNP